MIRNRGFLKHLDTFLVEIPNETIKKDAFLDLLLIIIEGLVGEVLIHGCLGHSKFK